MYYTNFFVRGMYIRFFQYYLDASYSMFYFYFGASYFSKTKNPLKLALKSNFKGSLKAYSQAP